LQIEAAAEKDVEELRRELQNSKQTTNCHLEELKELGGKTRTRINCLSYFLLIFFIRTVIYY